MVQKEILDNGLRVIMNKLENTQAITVLILVGAGSRYETKRINGLSHFLEHMFFKGAKKYQTARQVSETIDNMGGDFNAFTGKEYVGYYVKAAKQHVDTSLDVLSDMLIHAKHDPKEIEKERGVIMEELNMYQDTPMYQMGWDFERLIFGDQPMGWDQVGVRETIYGLTRDDFVKYQKDLYVPSNIVISISGNFAYDAMLEMVKQYFGAMPSGEMAYQYKPLEEHVAEKRLYLRNKKTEQAHICVGYPMMSEQDRDYWAMKLLGVILGGGMSSRMFLSVREEKGLAYYTNSSAEGFTDCGVFSTSAGVDLKRIDDAIEAVVGEYKKIREEEVPEVELTKAKEYTKGKTILRLEDSEEYAHMLGKYEVLYDELKSVDDVMKAVDAVTTDDILRLAKQIFVDEKMHLAVIGPYDDESRFLKMVQ